MRVGRCDVKYVRTDIELEIGARVDRLRTRRLGKVTTRNTWSGRAGVGRSWVAGVVPGVAIRLICSRGEVVIFLVLGLASKGTIAKEATSLLSNLLVGADRLRGGALLDRRSYATGRLYAREGGRIRIVALRITA